MSKPFQFDLFAQALLGGTILESVPLPALNKPEPPPSCNYRLIGDRPLSNKWSGRASDNIAAIRLAQLIIREGRPATEDEQAKLMLFTGFGASKLATSLFPVGDAPIRDGWEQLVRDLRQSVSARDLAMLARCTQYAHYTPEFMARALWRGVQRLGFTGGSIIEPGVGTGLFLALAPQAVADRSHLTGFELDPTTAQIARLLHPLADMQRADFTDPELDIGGPYDLAIGNPPFSDRSVKAEGDLRLSLHEYFIWRALKHMKPGGLAAFVVSRYLMDKGDQSAREAIAEQADLIAAIRMPQRAMFQASGTDVVVDLLFFRRHDADEQSDRTRFLNEWFDVVAVDAEFGAKQVVVNRYWQAHPEMVLGQHGVTSTQFGQGYTCAPFKDRGPIETLLGEAIERVGAEHRNTPATDATSTEAPPVESTPEPEPVLPTPELRIEVRSIAEGGTLREGSYLIDDEKRLCQVRGRVARPLEIRQGRSGPGIPASRAVIIRQMIQIRDATRDVLRAQEADQPWDEPLDRLQRAYNAFVFKHGPINLTKRIVRKTVRRIGETDEDTGEITVREVHGESTSYRRPNLEVFMDDPDVWLVAAVEDYEIDTEEATPGPIFKRRVVRPPSPPQIRNATDALAVVLNEKGRVDIDRIAELISKTPEQTIETLGERVFLDPETEQWELADAYLSGAVRTKLAVAEASTGIDPQYERNVEALRKVQPKDLKPSEITARLGAPYIEPALIAQFSQQVLGVATKVTHNVDLASWEVDKYPFKSTSSVWGTHRRHAGQLLEDALNSRVPKIFDTVWVGRTKTTELNVKETEAAKEKLVRIKRAFESWVWVDADRADALVRLYNAKFNNLVPRKFDGSHLMLPGMSELTKMRPHQLDGIWQCIAGGTTYLAHVVGSGKTIAGIAAVMEQRRLGLVRKAIVPVPSQTLAQWAREWLQLYPTARILVADEENFKKERRKEFLARAATGDWDDIVITHEAFKFIPAPAGFEGKLLQELIDQYEDALTRVSADDGLSRKRLEAMKEKLESKLTNLKARKDDLVTLSEIGVDQIVGDEFQAYRKLSFATNMSGLRGITPDGSQRAWDMFVKVRYIDTINANRALVALSGTPITNTMGELYTVMRFLDPDALEARGVHQFDAWAATFGDVVTNLELQPNGKYKPIARFAEFINVPELTVMFRMRASVISNEDIAPYLKLPKIKEGQRQIVTVPPTVAFKRYQAALDRRMKLIEERKGPPKKGDDIILTVIGDGRLAAIDLRFVLPAFENEPENKLNRLIDNAFAIWQRSAEDQFINPRTGQPYPNRGGAQMIFSDLGALSIEASRGFSAYRWIKDRLIDLGVPESQIAIMQQFKKTDDKLRLFNRVNAGAVRFLIGSSQTMGTGVNAQLRLKAEHHLDVPWLPSDLEQREGRIIRQGNQYDEVEIYAYATETSMDAPMWQTLERKARFIAAALKGDASVRRIEEDQSATPAQQFAMAKAIASGDPRLMQQADLASDVARLERLAAAHKDEQWTIRREVEWARGTIERATRRIPRLEADVTKRKQLEREDDEPCFAITVRDITYTDRKDGSAKLVAALRKLWIEQAHGHDIIGNYRGFSVFADGQDTTFDKKQQFDLSFGMEFTERSQEIAWGPDTMPHVLIQRLDKAVDGLDAALDIERRWLTEARTRLESYQPRLGELFPQKAELERKKTELEAIETSLAADAAPNGKRAA